MVAQTAEMRFVSGIFNLWTLVCRKYPFGSVQGFVLNEIASKFPGKWLIVCCGVSLLTTRGSSVSVLIILLKII